MANSDFVCYDYDRPMQYFLSNFLKCDLFIVVHEGNLNLVAMKVYMLFIVEYIIYDVYI